MDSMKKQQLLDTISQALDAMGASDGSGDDMYGESEDTGSTVPIWSQLQVGVEDKGRGPLYDKSSLFTAPQGQKQQMTTTAYGMPVDDEGAEMMSALGMV